MKKLIVIIAYLLSFYSNCEGQSNDLEAIKFIAKLYAYQEYQRYCSSDSVNFSNLEMFIQNEAKASIIKSQGFWQKIYFVKVVVGSNNPIEFILATKSSRYAFRLKGFLDNDFGEFINMLKTNEYENLRTAKKFSNSYSVDGLDFFCLFEAYKAKSKDYKKYPCLKHLFEVFIIP